MPSNQLLKTVGAQNQLLKLELLFLKNSAIAMIMLKGNHDRIIKNKIQVCQVGLEDRQTVDFLPFSIITTIYLGIYFGQLD